MTIATSWGSDIIMTEARMVPVWIEQQSGRIKWHYAEKKPTRLTKEIRCEPIWHYRGKYARSGELIHSGKWTPIFPGLVADNGIQEIMDECNRLAPDEKAKFERWNKSGGPAAPDLFPIVKPAEIA